MKKCEKCGYKGKEGKCPKCGGPMKPMGLSEALGKDIPQYAHGTMPMSPGRRRLSEMMRRGRPAAASAPSRTAPYGPPAYGNTKDLEDKTPKKEDPKQVM